MSEIRILKAGSCPSLSGKSTLSYHIGCNDGKEVYLRLTENTGQGIFNKEWISLEEIEKVLAAKQPITSGSLHELFQGKSSNSAGFFLAVLKEEGLVKISESNLRHYEHNNPAEFNIAVQELMAPGNLMHVFGAIWCLRE